MRQFEKVSLAKVDLIHKSLSRNNIFHLVHLATRTQSPAWLCKIGLFAVKIPARINVSD
jgi:hypothetical protein